MHVLITLDVSDREYKKFKNESRPTFCCMVVICVMEGRVVSRHFKCFRLNSRYQKPFTVEFKASFIG